MIGVYYSTMTGDRSSSSDSKLKHEDPHVLLAGQQKWTSDAVRSPWSGSDMADVGDVDSTPIGSKVVSFPSGLIAGREDLQRHMRHHAGCEGAKLRPSPTATLCIAPEPRSPFGGVDHGGTYTVPGHIIYALPLYYMP